MESETTTVPAETPGAADEGLSHNQKCLKEFVADDLEVVGVNAATLTRFTKGVEGCMEGAVGARWSMVISKKHSTPDSMVAFALAHEAMANAVSAIPLFVDLATRISNGEMDPSKLRDLADAALAKSCFRDVIVVKNTSDSSLLGGFVSGEIDPNLIR
jgi:hypothetical protein